MIELIGLDKNGYSKCNVDFDLNKLEKFMFNIKKNSLIGKKLSDSVVEFGEENIKSIDELSDIFDKINNFSKNFYDGKLKFTKTWYVKTNYKISDYTKLPYVPHIDRFRRIKFFLYLNDVKSDNGPLTVMQVNPKNYENKRLKLKYDWQKKFKNKVEDTGQFIKLTGNKGSCFVMDTNTPHKAGIVKRGYFRHILRFDYELDGWNYESFLYRLDRFIRSRISING